MVVKSTFTRTKKTQLVNTRTNGPKHISYEDVQFLSVNRNNIWKLTRQLRPIRGPGPSSDSFSAHFLNLCNDQSTSAYPPPFLLNSLPSPPSTFFDTSITLDEILFSLSKVKFNAAPGKDGVTYKLLIDNCELLEIGDYPAEWKSALISPVYKKGCPLDPANYRPIALQSVAIKYVKIL